MTLPSRAPDDNLGIDLAMLARDPIDVVDALGAAAVVDQKVADNGVAHQGEFSGAGRGRQSDRRAVEIRSGETAALALVAIVTGGAAAMRNRQVGDAVGHDAPAKLTLDHVFGLLRAAGKIHGRQKLSVGQLRQALARSTDTDIAFDHVVVGLKFLVADGPIFAVAVASGSLEFIVAVAIAFARPAERLSSNLTAANPKEGFVRGKGVGVLQIVDEELMAVFVAGVAQALHRLRLKQALLVAKAAELQLVGPDVFGEIACRYTRRASFEHNHGDSALGQLFGDPSATSAGTDDQHFMDLSARQEHEANSVAKTQNLDGGTIPLALT